MNDMAGDGIEEKKRPPRSRAAAPFYPHRYGDTDRRSDPFHGASRFTQCPGVELGAPIAPPRATH